MTELSEEEALAVIRPHFELLRETAAGAGYPVRARLECDRSIRDSDRHFAACMTDGSLVLVAPELAETPPETLQAILAHEIGHVLDFQHPGVFALSLHGIIVRRRDAFDDKAWRTILRGWKERDEDVVERSADAIAEHVFGVRIGYYGPCLLQTYSKGIPRPAGLR